MSEDKIYIELNEKNELDNSIIQDKQKKTKYYLLKSKGKKLKISLILLFASLICIFFYMINYDKKKLEKDSGLEGKNKILIEEMKEMKKEILEMKQKLEIKDSELEKADEKMLRMELKMNRMNTELNELKRNDENMERDDDSIKYNGNEELEKQKGSTNSIDSKILELEEELKFIEKRITSNRSKKRVNYKLLFRGTRDGTSARVFHSKCDNITGTLTIVKTDKGLRFGGYTEALWNPLDTYGYRDDKEAFVFSLDLKKIYNSKNGVNAIIPNVHYGPVFGTGVFEINSLAFKNGGQSCPDPNYSYSKNELTKGDFIFEVVEIEVYQILSG